jgi:hypothetical protein
MSLPVSRELPETFKLLIVDGAEVGRERYAEMSRCMGEELENAVARLGVGVWMSWGRRGA